MSFWHCVGVDLESCFYGGAPELLLSNLGRNAEVVQQRGVNVAELVPHHAVKPSSHRSKTEYPSISEPSSLAYFAAHEEAGVRPPET